MCNDVLVAVCHKQRVACYSLEEEVCARKEGQKEQGIPSYSLEEEVGVRTHSYVEYAPLILTRHQHLQSRPFRTLLLLLLLYSRYRSFNVLEP